MVNKLNFVEEIFSQIYPFIIKDWKNTSLLVNKNNKTNKAFKDVLKSLIAYASEKSDLFISYSTINNFKKEMDINLDLNKSETLLDIYKSFEEINKIKESFDMNLFLDKAIEHLSGHYFYINALRPQGWEQFILNNNVNTINISNYKKKISTLRKQNFNGLVFSDGSLEFFDSISLCHTAKAYFDEQIPPYKMLFASIVAYTFKYNEYMNTLKMNENIMTIHNQNNIQLKKSFSQYINYEEKKVEFEIIEENKKKKQDLDKILNKLAKV